MACVRKRRGKWVADYRSPDGKRRWITRETRKDAEKALAAVNVAVTKGEYVSPDENRTLKAVYDHWFRLCVEGSDNKPGKPLAPKTQGLYSMTWRRYVEPHFGARKLSKMDAGELAEWKEKLGQSVGPKSVLNAVQLVDALFKHARRFHWTIANPLEDLRRPKYKAKVRAFTPEELAALLKKADTQTSLAIRLAATTGLRAGELWGLKFEDIDFTRSTVAVTRQLQDGNTKDLKTTRSRRYVPVSKAILTDLRDHPRRFGGGFVFVSPESQDEERRAKRIKEGENPDIPMDHDNFGNRIWRPLLEAAGIEEENERGRVTFHSLRHTAATAAIASGANVVTVQNMVGHASAKTTLDTYTDAWAAQVEHSGEAVANVLFGSSDEASGSKTVAEDSTRKTRQLRVVSK